MSHEGIRVVPDDEAHRVEEQELELSQAAVEPEHVRVNQTEGTGMEIDWKDGHTSQWTFEWLRAACPCAFCIEIRKAEGRAPGQPKELGQPMLDPRTGIPRIKPPARPRKVHAVGRYAISFDWNDGHTSGIFSWHYLRSICICETCQRSRNPEGLVTPSPES